MSCIKFELTGSYCYVLFVFLLQQQRLQKAISSPSSRAVDASGEKHKNTLIVYSTCK
jgi:hypothetical protein